MLTSILDNDLYKFTMQQFVLECFPNAKVTYRFTNRDLGMTFNKAAFEAIKQAVYDMQHLRLTEEEAQYLWRACPFFKVWYLDYLRNYRYDPDQVVITEKHGELTIEIAGTWAETILWEVPLMAVISQAYFKHVDTDWTINDQYDQNREKAAKLFSKGCVVAEFGTRRRRCYNSQDYAVRAFRDEAKNHPPGLFVGTSNIHFAMVHGLKPKGTMAHELVMGVSALRGLRHANHNALHLWAKVYDADLGIALTDTYGSEAFFGDFDLKLSKMFDGVRHDSGNPYVFAEKVIAHYEDCGIDPTSKTIVFSDGLNVDVAINLNDYCRGKVNCSFGIGTHLTNDFKNSKGEKSKPLNMVIKLRTCDGHEVVKLSDDVGKATGDNDAVRVAKWTFFGTPLDA